MMAHGKGTPRTEVKEKISENSEKPLDKPLKMWYNKGIDGDEVERTTSYKKAEIQQDRTLGNVRLWRKWVRLPSPPLKKFLTNQSKYDTI